MIVTGMITHNEENRFLEPVIESVCKFSDKIIIMDDASSDGTVKELKYHFINNNFYWYDIQEGKKRLFDINESFLRNALYFKCLKECVDSNDWLFIVDADEIIDNSYLIPKLLNHFKDFADAGTVSFKLFDMWNETHYRDDELWNAHKRFFPFGIRRNCVIEDNRINNSKLHCGRFPIAKGNSFTGFDIKVRHMGWSTELDRERKFKRYIELDKNGKYGSLKQYNSILDKNPNLVEYNFNGGNF
jgi:glycosyltransferase involved in cell wall biosynthesis